MSEVISIEDREWQKDTAVYMNFSTTGQMDFVVPWYVARNTEPGELYYDPNSNIGVAPYISREIGIPEKLASAIVEKSAALGIVESTFKETANGFIPRSVAVTSKGREFVDAYMHSNAKEFKAVEAFVLDHRKSTAELVWHEVNMELGELNEPVQMFDDAAAESLDTLDVYLEQLRKQQTQLLVVIDPVEVGDTVAATA